MKQQILVIHGGNAFETREEYLNYLAKKEFSLEKLRSVDWKANLRTDLGEDFDVLTPKMPNEHNARYEEWKIWFEKIADLLNEGVVLVGHSLGGIFLAKYLSENKFPKKIKATFLVAAPYNTPKIHPLVDFNITSSLEKFSEQSEKIIIYQSKDDRVVPWNNAKRYHKGLPHSEIKLFKDRKHFGEEHFIEIIRDIKSFGK